MVKLTVHGAAALLLSIYTARLLPTANTFFSSSADMSSDVLNHFKFWLPSPTGPYGVGSLEVEIPVSSLVDGLQDGDSVQVKVDKKEGTIDTILFRVYYPCVKQQQQPSQNSTSWSDIAMRPFSRLRGLFARKENNITRKASKPVYWIPEPFQMETLKSYMRFGGMTNEHVINSVTKISQLLNFVKLPAIENAPLLSHENDNSRQFPSVIFSHGLGGTRLAYSTLCTSMASHGMVVFAPEHRDGTGPITFIRKKIISAGVKGPNAGNRSRKEVNYKYESLEYITIPHTLTDDMADNRDYQLSVRFNEMSLLYKAIRKINEGVIPEGTLLGPEGSTTVAEIGGDGNGLGMFHKRLDLNPGRVIWAGHSFGAATVAQFIKTVFYSDTPKEKVAKSYVPLLNVGDAGDDTGIKEQITRQTPLLLLDLWSLSLMGSGRTNWLWRQPLPQVVPSGDGNDKSAPILTIMSDKFYVWKENMWAVKWILSRNPGRRDGGIAEFFNYDPPTDAKANSTASIQPITITTATQDKEKDYREPKLFYSKKSAHLTQSDFGQILSLFFASEAPQPRKVMQFNIRAVLQWLRVSGYRTDLAPHSDDAEIFAKAEKEDGDIAGKGEIEGWVRLGLHEEKIKRRDVQEAVREGMSATAEADVEVEAKTFEVQYDRESRGKGMEEL